MANKPLRRRRLSAFHLQDGRCYYWTVKMWTDDCRSFASRFAIPLRIAQPLQCTTEHLQARCNGGSDSASNIVAACWRCKHQQHSRKTPLGPEPYRRHVKNRLAKNRWHHQQVFMRGLIAQSACL